MNKFRQCIYTTILIVTCFVASPFIFKEIWHSSSEKEKKETLPPITLNVTTQPAQQTTEGGSPEATTGAQQAATDAQPADPAATTTEAPATTEAPTEAQLSFVQSDPSYFDDALFLGDSRMVGIKEYGTIDNADFFCTEGLSTYKVDSEYIDGNSFAGMLQSKKYGKVYIMLGINEVGNDFNYTVNSYNSIINTVKTYQPDALIFLLANLHVTTASENSMISNERINYLNSCIAQFADNKTVFYLDINPTFDDGNGALRSDATGDGVHVYANYYPMWCEWLSMNTIKK
ncbi:MAG: lipase [Ruminococcus sp.]|nr:lipase [Ruminococcus sp.]